MSDNHVIEGDHGTITVPGGTLAALVTRAAQSVDGAKVRRRGVDLKLAGDEARIRLELNVRYGAVLPEVGRDVQDAVAGALARMCGIEAATVSLHVEELEG